MKAFENKEFDTVEIIYSEFKNAATQRFVVERFLPVLNGEERKGQQKLILFLILQRQS